MRIILLQFLIGLLAMLSPCYIYSQNQGDTIEVEGSQYQITSDNIITNPGFEDGFTAWTDATTATTQLTTAKFNLVATGGVDGSQYLVGTTNEGSSASGSIGTGWNIEAGKMYCFSYHVKYLDASATAGSEPWVKVSLTNDKTSSSEPQILIDETVVEGGGAWTKNTVVFTNSAPYNYIVARFRWLSNRLGFDSFSLYEVAEVANTSALESLIAEAEALYNPEANGAADFQTAINAAKAALTDGAIEGIKQATTDLSQAITSFKLNNASPESPVDMTDWIVNPAFDENLQDGWKGVGTINYNCVEFYQKTFNMYQKITGLPAGKYRLKAQGFERPTSNDGGAAYTAGTEVIHAELYAGANSFAEKQTVFNSLYQLPYNGGGSSNGYVGTMSSAKMVMSISADNYLMQLDNIMLDAEDTLVIGAKSDFTQNYYWVLFDNFQLEYIGQFDAGDLVLAIEEQIEVAQSLLAEKLQNTATDLLNGSIQQAQQTIAAQPLVYDDLYASSQELNTSIKTAKISIEAYIKLQTAIDEGTVELELLSGTRADNLQIAINEAQVVVDNLEATLQTIQTATSNINTIIKKQIYIPTWMMGDVNDPNNSWSMERSRQSKNWIVFWEPGYGQDPGVVVDGNYRINIDKLLDEAENAYTYYTDSLKFISHDGSKSSKYKMIIRLRYTRDWEATGSGVDNTIGLLTLTAWSAQVGGHTMAHEVGHCFQYQVHCDNGDQNGWMYGFGANASGGNGWWEQCAQWQGFKIYPEEQFTSSNFSTYLSNAHKHIIHEAPRYSNYFIQDYWVYKHGLDIIGRLWNESVKPEDPVEAYKRITGINQTQFNDEMYERAARFTTWDIPGIQSYGEGKISLLPQTSMTDVGNDYWLVDESMCPENYGYNVIRLNVPATSKQISVFFEGKMGMDGYRAKFVTMGGWRYGFVAMLSDGTRVYSDMASASYDTPNGSLQFECPANTLRLWLVVTGAPSVHWRHAWDDDDSNDEQWPYQVSFNNTNLYGKTNIYTSTQDVFESTIQVYAQNNELVVSQMTDKAQLSVYSVTGKLIWKENVNTPGIRKVLPSGIYIVHIQTDKENLAHKVLIE